MKELLTSSLLSELSSCIAERMGLFFQEKQWPDLVRGIAGAAKEFGFHSLEECAHWLMSAPLNQHQIEILAGQLTIGETYFLREKQAFDVLQQEILPELIRTRHDSRKLRFWSAACCTGEEPYSIAITLHRSLPDLADWDISILATDINPHFLQKAGQGHFGNWSFRDVPPEIQNLYFTSNPDGTHSIIPAIRKMVSFQYLNLVSDEYPSASSATENVDVIFCRNVLMYFNADCRRSVLHKLNQSLMPGGWLIPGQTEVSTSFAPPFQLMRRDNIHLCRKPLHPPPVPPQPFIWTPPAPARKPPISTLPVLVKRNEQGFHPIGQPDTPQKAKPLAPATAMSNNPTSVSRQPSHEPSLSLLDQAGIAFERGDYEETIRLLLPVDEQSCVPIDHLVCLAKAYANLGKHADAMKWINKAIALDKLSAEAHYIRSLVFLETGVLDEAQKSLNHALYLNPNHILSHVTQAQTAQALNKPGLAKKHLQTAIHLIQRMPPDTVVPDSGGLSAARFNDILAKRSQSL